MAALRIFEPKGGSRGDFVDKGVNLSFEGQPLENHEARCSSVQVIVAALNEEQGIGLTIAELKDTLDSPRILVVDGHSIDKTVEIAKSLGVDIAFRNGVGKARALTNGAI